MSLHQRTLRNNQIEFENLMVFATLTAEENPSALVEFIRLLARPLQSALMIDAVIKGDRRDVPSVDTRNFFLG